MATKRGLGDRVTELNLRDAEIPRAVLECFLAHDGFSLAHYPVTVNKKKHNC
jgi:hypothetical protein